ncbi:hypothetical protein LY78DRAFT_669805 [Colletotrichum sublineola]|nr:hypothetical protein LY78DRAFT_669805 [Colletotrichum sublineola]
MQGITWKHAFLGLILMESLGLALVLPSGAMVKRSNDVSAKTRRESLSLDKTLHIRDDHDDDDDDDDDDDYGYYSLLSIHKLIPLLQMGHRPRPKAQMAVKMGLDGGHNRIPLLLVRTVVMMVLEGEPNTQIPHHGRIMVAIDLNRDREIKIPRHHLGQMMVIVMVIMALHHHHKIRMPRGHLVGETTICTVPVWQQKQAPPKAPGDQPGGPNPGSGPDQPGSNPKPPRDVNRD